MDIVSIANQHDCCYGRSTVPSTRRIAVITRLAPVPKCSPVLEPADHKPISLTPILLTIVARLMVIWLFSYDLFKCLFIYIYIPFIYIYLYTYYIYLNYIIYIYLPPVHFFLTNCQHQFTVLRIQRRTCHPFGFKLAAEIFLVG